MIFNDSDDPITVILVDNHPVVRAGYRRLIESTIDIHVIAEAEDSETGCLLYQKHQPNVIILDFNMPGINGFETIRRIKAINLFARILVFSMHSHETMAQHALATGATGYLTKQYGANQMIQAIRLVKQGKIYIDPQLTLTINAKSPLDDVCEKPFNAFPA